MGIASRKSKLLSTSNPPSEFATSDGCGDSYIQAIGCLSLMKIWNEQFPIDALTYFLRDSVPLITHDDKSASRELLGIDVLPVQESAIDRIGIR
jgi:hypothetical protein